MMPSYRQTVGKFVEEGAPDGCWAWKGPRDRKGAPISFAVSASKFNNDPGWAVYERHRAVRRRKRKTLGTNGRIVRTCGTKDCMNPAHLELQPHRHKQLEAGEKRWRVEAAVRKKEAPILFAMDYIRRMDEDEQGRYGQAKRAAEARANRVVIEVEKCERCDWPVKQCACYKQGKDLTE